MPIEVYINHIPKCAGTTVSTAVESWFPASAIFSYSLFDPSQALSWPFLRSHVCWLPPALLEGRRLATGHFGEMFRRLRCADAYSIALVREPGSRCRSLLRHIAGPGVAVNAPELQPFINRNVPLDPREANFRQCYLGSSMVAYLCEDPGLVWGPYTNWQKAYESAAESLSTYDLIITTDRVRPMLSHLARLFQAAPIVPIALNMRSGAEAAPDLAEDFNAKLAEVIPEEFALYAYADRLAQAQLDRIEQDADLAVFDDRGRLAAKRNSFSLDLGQAISLFNFNQRSKVNAPEWAPHWARTLAADRAGIDLAVAPGRRNLFLTLWSASVPRLDDLAFFINGMAMMPQRLQPDASRPNIVTFAMPFEVTRRAGWTRVELLLPGYQVGAEHIWLFDCSVTGG